jgi:hypothetical protein
MGQSTHTNHWHPSWYKPEHESAWDRIREAVRRDWMQTKHDLHMGGHELNQKGSDTYKQAAGKETIPDINQANPPKVIGDLDGEWERVEPQIEYGYAARRQFGSKYAQWNSDLEQNLRGEWERDVRARGDDRRWDDVSPMVRRGYDYKS